jgi:hypothetical protein
MKLTTPEEIINRLEILENKMNQEGLYVSANTCGLGADIIKNLLDRIFLLEQLLKEQGIG